MAGAPADSNRSQPNASTVKLAVHVPYSIASLIALKSVRFREASLPIKAPAKESPAPVGSRRSVTGYAGKANKPSS